MMTSKQLRHGCMRTPNESSEILEKFYVQAFRHKRQVWSALLLQLSCINRTVLLFSFFSTFTQLNTPLLPIVFRPHKLNFSIYFRPFSPPHHLFFIPMRETSHLAFFFRAVISAPDHWTARTREWRSPCVERNNLPSVFPLSEFSNPSDLALLYSRWQPQSLDKYVHSY